MGDTIGSPPVTEAGWPDRTTWTGTIRPTHNHDVRVDGHPYYFDGDVTRPTSEIPELDTPLENDGLGGGADA